MEARFHSSNLVKYLAHILKMGASGIRYKLITHKDLKSFIKYILNNFEQKTGQNVGEQFYR